MAVGEHAVELTAGEGGAEPAAEEAEREAVVDFVGQDAGVIASRVDAVEVFPFREGAAEEDVAKLPAGDVVLVDDFPAGPERADPRLQRDAGAIADSAHVGDDRDFFPRRTQPLKGTGSLVPRKHLGRRPLDAD